MNSHKHAGLTLRGRALLVSRVLDEGWRVALASEAAGVSERTGYKWLARFKAEGAAGLADRSSRPHGCPHQTSAQERQQLEQLRRQGLRLCPDPEIQYDKASCHGNDVRSKWEHLSFATFEDC